MSKRWTDADRGISPIIAVALTVTITVVLAALLGSMVLDFGQTTGDAAPSASLTVEANPETGNLTLRHTGGDALHPSQTRVVVRNDTTDVTFAVASVDGFVLSVGGEARIDLSDDDNGVDWNGDGSHDAESVSGNHPFEGVATDSQYTVELIDMDTERVIYETQVIA